MGMSFGFYGEDGSAYRVEFSILKKEHIKRAYGIRAEIFQEGVLVEYAEATNRFFTRAEAEKTVELLCQFQVTPCTLCDVI